MAEKENRMPAETRNTVEIPKEARKGSPSSPRKIQKKMAKKYWTVPLYKTGEALDKLNGLVVATCNPTSEHDAAGLELGTHKALDLSEDVSRLNTEVPLSVPERMSCNCCAVEFETRTEQREHFKSDWHRYNLQQRIQGKSSVTQEKFEEICASETVSSISGSDSDTEEESHSYKALRKPMTRSEILKDNTNSSCDSDQETGTVLDEAARKYPKIFFQNSEGQLISVYRCVIQHKKVKPTSHSELVSMVTNLPNQMKWAVIMCGGGHFAAAIFDRQTVVVHKTFHRYVVRAKRGTAQGARDSQGNAPKSAGASIRRHNEEALKEDIKTLLESWKGHLETCDRIFLRAPGSNKGIFLHGKSPPFDKGDERIRMIPFATRRPTHNEVRRVFEMLSSIECYGDESETRDHIPLSPPVTFNPELGELQIIPEDQNSLTRQKRLSGRQRAVSPLVSDGCENTHEQVKEALVHKGQQLQLLENVLQTEHISSSGASTASDTELVESMETLLTSDLKEFDSTKRPKKRKQRKRHLSKHQVEPESDIYAEEKYHLKNSLYTACKMGDVETLKNLVAIFSSVVEDGNSDEKGDHEKQVKSDEENQNKKQDNEKQVQSEQESENKNQNNMVQIKENKNNVPQATTQSDLSDERINRISYYNENTTDIEESDLDSTNVTMSKPEPLSENRSLSQLCEMTVTCCKDNNYIEMNIDSDMTESQSGNASQPIPPMKSEELSSPVVTSDILNETIGDNKITLLHVASKEGHRKVIKVLLDCGADPSIRDKYGQTPFNFSKDKETRNEYRRFMGKYPLKYDYKLAQIPSPLTEEMELVRKQKDAEKKKAQKKAKQQRMKEQKEKEEIVAAEEREKKRFLALSDREKRALAAEKRLLQASQAAGHATPILSRCYQCGCDITGKVPFEYYDFKFCSPKCLQQHRKNEKKS